MSIIAAALLLSACSQFQKPEAVSPVPDEDQIIVTTGKEQAGKVVSESGQPVGIVLESGLTLRFQTPRSKLYTDPLAFETAVQSGIGAFLISLREPSWSNNCLSQSGSIEHDAITLCRVGEVDVRQQLVTVSGTKVWLSVPVSQGKADEDIVEVAESLRVTE